MIQLLLAVFPLFILVYSCLEKQANGISHPIISECERVVCQSNTHVNARIEQDVTR